MPLKEEEIRPLKIFDEYLRLAKEDAETYFSEVERVVGGCPACCTQGEYAFDKYGFTYQVCPSCQTLFVNPRPTAVAFSRYYTESPSSRYWASTFYMETAGARREKLWKPKARLIRDTLARCGAVDHTLTDIGGGYGLFADEIRSLCGQAPIVIEPGPDLAAACREKVLPVVQKFLKAVVPADLPAGPKAFVSFELLEHLHDPADPLRQLNGLMASGDLFIFTTLSGTGVDIQALWEDSKSVSPPPPPKLSQPALGRPFDDSVRLRKLGSHHARQARHRHPGQQSRSDQSLFLADLRRKRNGRRKSCLA